MEIQYTISMRFSKSNTSIKSKVHSDKFLEQKTRNKKDLKYAT